MANPIPDALTASQYICISWDPSKSRPLNVYYVKINDIPIARSNPNDPDAPITFRVPPAYRGQRVTVSWDVAPSVNINGITVTHSTLGPGGPVLILSTTKDEHCKLPGSWQVDDEPVQL
jgi:hypothetical protein